MLEERNTQSIALSQCFRFIDRCTNISSAHGNLSIDPKHEKHLAIRQTLLSGTALRSLGKVPLYIAICFIANLYNQRNNGNNSRQQSSPDRLTR